MKFFSLFSVRPVKREPIPLVSPSVGEFLDLMIWFQSINDINISKGSKTYSIMVFEHIPLCHVVTQTDYHKTLVEALREAKIKHDGYLEIKKKLEEAKLVISES